VVFLDWAALSQNVGSLYGGGELFLAWLSHIGIYKPILRWRRSFGSRAQ
jgi:hypothetical protein